MRTTVLIISALFATGVGLALSTNVSAASESSEPEAQPALEEAQPTTDVPEVAGTEAASSETNKRRSRKPDLSPEIIERLDGEQLQAVLLEKELTKRKNVEAVGPEIAAPLGFFVSMMVIVFLPLFFRWRQQMLLHETLRAMVEKGAEIPVELIAPQKRKPNDLRRGVILLAMGVGLSIFLALIPDVHTGVWACGLIPALMGAGYLAVWRLQQKQEQANSQSRE